jgi:hypothetical protein
MIDPLQLSGKPHSNATAVSRAAPHPDVERLYARVTNGQHADSIEVRVLLLAHLIYIAYRDVKETFAV